MLIRIVPHFTRLHEWIALEDRLFEQEGLEPELLSDVMHDVSGDRESSYFERPEDRPFVERREVANSACEWGSVCNAGAGMGHFPGAGAFRLGAQSRSGQLHAPLGEQRPAGTRRQL